MMMLFIKQHEKLSKQIFVEKLHDSRTSFRNNTIHLFFQKSQRRQQHAVKETEFLRLKRSRLGVEDFESLRVIGKGAFGEVGIDAHTQ